jgi:opacity protein-like surface antigen
MNKILMATAFLLLLPLSALAHGLYLSADLGPALYHDSDVQNDDVGENQFDAINYGAGGDVALGYAFNSNIRTEIEAGYRYAHIDKLMLPTGQSGVTRLGVLGVFGNVYFDFADSDRSVTPYVGVGLGVLNGAIKVVNGPGSYSDSSLGYQAAAGVSFKVNDKLSMNVGYKLQAAAHDFEGTILGINGKTSYLNSNFLVGLRHNF